MKFVVDRFENNYAIIELEDKTITHIPKLAIPKETKEGDVLIIKIDEIETQRRKKEIENLMNELFE